MHPETCLYIYIISSHASFWACSASFVPPDVSSAKLEFTLHQQRSSLSLSTHFVYGGTWCSPHLPRYTVLTGSTARAVATRSSALCRRPLTMSRPSIFPTTKIRLPYTKQGTHRGAHYTPSIQTHSKTETAGWFTAELKLPQMLYCNDTVLLTGPTNPKSPDRTNGISPMGTPLELTGIT